MNGQTRAVFFFSHGGEGESRTRAGAAQTTTAPPSRRTGPESMLSLSTGEV